MRAPGEPDSNPEEESAGRPGESQDLPSEGERDWDSEWESLTTPLAAEPRQYLVSDTPVVGAGQGPRDYVPAPDPDEDHWHPEPPPPATASPKTRLAWACVLGGPLLLVLATVTVGYAEVWFVGMCLAIFVTGCVLGLSQLEGRRDDDPSGGAQV